MRQQTGDEFLLFNGSGFGLEHQTHGGVFAGLVAHAVKHPEDGRLELGLLRRECFFARLHLGVGELFDFFQHLLAADTRRQFVHHQLPLAARQIFNNPAGAHLERATARGVSVSNVSSAADDLTAAGVIGAGHYLHQLGMRELGVFDQGDTSVGHFAQVVAGDFSGHAHRDTAGPIQQGKWQAGRQLLGLLGRAVVVGLEVHCALVDFIEQQTGDARQTCLGVAHGGRAVAIARAEIALTVNQRVTLRKILRHAHQGVIGRAVTVRVVTAQDIAHHASAFDGSCAHRTVRATKAQTHARHRIQNAPLHRLLAIAHIGQGAAFDHAQGVFKVGTLGVSAQVVPVRRGRFGGVGGDQVCHVFNA